MVKSKRVKRPAGELKAELVEQVQLLQHASRSFDQGFEAVGKHIALTLRLLLHTYGRQRGLLEQLGLRSIPFFDSAGPLNPNNLLSECNLVGMRLSSASAKNIPLVAMGGGPQGLLPTKFVDWWNNPVLKDQKGRTFCRRELVQNVAETDGGAHVDPELEEAYLEFSRRKSLGWVFVRDGRESEMEGRIELACMRQIAHEVLSSLQHNVPELAVVAAPVVPEQPQSS